MVVILTRSDFNNYRWRIDWYSWTIRMMNAVGSVAAWLLSGSCPCSVVKVWSKSVGLSNRERVYDGLRRQKDES